MQVSRSKVAYRIRIAPVEKREGTLLDGAGESYVPDCIGFRGFLRMRYNRVPFGKRKFRHRSSTLSTMLEAVSGNLPVFVLCSSIASKASQCSVSPTKYVFGDRRRRPNASMLISISKSDWSVASNLILWGF